MSAPLPAPMAVETSILSPVAELISPVAQAPAPTNLPLISHLFLTGGKKFGGKFFFSQYPIDLIMLIIANCCFSHLFPTYLLLIFR
jgi:hypothetical protein